MKAAALRHFNDLVSLTVLALMAAALIAGQMDEAAYPAESMSEPSIQVVLEVRNK